MRPNSSKYCFRLLFLICLIITLFGVLVLPAVAQERVQTPYISWSPDGTMLAVGSDTEVTILDAQTLQPLNRFSDLEEQQAEAAWSPDGQQLALIDGADVEVWAQPWDAEMANNVVTYQYYTYLDPPEPEVNVTAVTWSPDGQRIAIVTGGVVDIWDASSGMKVRSLGGEFDWIYDLIWYNDGQLAISDSANYAYLLDPQTGSLLKGFTLIAMVIGEVPEGLWSVALNPDGGIFAAGSGFGEVLIWDDTTPTGEYTSEYAQRFGGGSHDYSSMVLSLVWSPTGPFLASSTADGKIQIWDTQTWETVSLIELGDDIEVTSVAWSPDGRRLAYGLPDGSVTFLDATQLPGYAP